jgi:hypothetical protein
MEGARQQKRAVDDAWCGVLGRVPKKNDYDCRRGPGRYGPKLVLWRKKQRGKATGIKHSMV